MDMVRVDAANVDRTGFFCCMSKKKSEGYQRKLRWIKDRFREGLSLKLLAPPERGMIEYLPGEQAWRAVHAEGFTFIHCLWVVGKSKGKGLGVRLLDNCVEEAKKAKSKGVAMITSERVWLADRRLLASRGFECVDEEPPFSLMVKSFGKHPRPRFDGNWVEKQRALGKGLTILRSDQCPYVDDAARLVVETAEKLGIKHRVLEIGSRQEMLRWSPTPYGVFGIVLDGKLLSYHYLLEKDLIPLLKARASKH